MSPSRMNKPSVLVMGEALVDVVTRGSEGPTLMGDPETARQATPARGH